MPTSLQNAGANLPASDYAPIHVNRMVTGMWSNSNPLRDAATPLYVEKYQGGRQDRIKDGLNTEISPRLTLRRRPGLKVYNSQNFPPIRRYYGWNTFTTTDENVRVMVDTDQAVYDATGPNTKTNIFTKSAAAQDGKHKTFFLGVGNILYMTNGIDLMQYVYPSGQLFPFGITAPTQAPDASIPSGTSYGQWAPNVVIQRVGAYGGVFLVDANNNVQHANTYGKSGGSEPAWNATRGGTTNDGTILWQNVGDGQWLANHAYGFGSVVILFVTASDGNTYFYQNMGSGVTGANPPNWLPGLNSVTVDNGYSWINMGRILRWADIGANITVGGQATILDVNGGVQQCLQAGKTGTGTPNFTQIKNAFTSDPAGYGEGVAVWQNIGSIAAVQWGYAFKNSVTKDISGMSPASYSLNTSDGELVTVTGLGTGQAGADTVIVYRTEHGGAIFYYAGELANPGDGNTWTFNDNVLDADLNLEIQAQVLGEGTPPPAGGTCMEYHLGRVWIASGNVVYGSSGPDAVVAGSSGNAGFNLSFTAQSKVTRLWANSIGLFVFTVRDSYVILQDSNTGTLYMQKWIEQVPLLSYDAFCVLLTTPHLFTGYRTVVQLDSGAGIVEMSFPVADKVAQIDAASAYCTMLTGPSGETAMYLSDGATLWYRMAPTSAPESGINWSPAAMPVGGMSAVQAVEVLPGQTALLIGPAANGPILQRDVTVNTDNGAKYAASADIGSVVLALPGQLAGLAWMTLEATSAGSAPSLGVLLDEVDGAFQNVPRTRQDPTNLPPSKTVQSNRHSLLQNQRPVWCRHMQYQISWPAEDAANELLTSTIFGQTWQEMRTQ